MTMHRESNNGIYGNRREPASRGLRQLRYACQWSFSARINSFFRGARFVVQISALCAGLLRVAAAGAASTPGDIRVDATVRVIEQVMPTVVNIATETVVPVQDLHTALMREFFGQQSTETLTSLGSGVVIDENGYLLTNDHVVRRADRIAVKFNTGTNIYQATVVAQDRQRDVALLKINGRPGEKFQAIKMAREDDLLLGETVLALGNPFGLGGSVSRGILSSKSRTLPKEGAPLDVPNWLQTDAPINPGNSGGPLINLRGELIGLNVAVLSQIQGQPVQGIGFAIPIRLVYEALGNILPGDVVKGYWFGARIKVGRYPLEVTAVQEDSPAARAGIREGDTVLEVNGRIPRTIVDFTELLTQAPARDVRLTIRREADLKELKVKLVPEAEFFNSDLIRKKLGLELEPARRRGASVFLVTGVDSRGPAAQAGIQQDMVVTGINDQAPDDIKSFARILNEKKRGQSVVLGVLIQERTGPWYRIRNVPVEVAVR